MITVKEATKEIIERSRYLSEALSKGLINVSALSRYIRPEVEQMLIKPISEASVLMAVKRLENDFKPKTQFKNVFTETPNMVVRSNLVKITASGDLKQSTPNTFFAMTRDEKTTTIITGKKEIQEILNQVQDDEVLDKQEKLSAITITLPKEALETSGVFYFFLKSLAWEGINIVEMISNYLELTIVVEDKDIQRAFAILQSLFVE